jgi:dipeptidyl-peptidase-4
MDTPQNNPEGYERTSVVKAAKNLHGRLLLLHGAIDDNVHIENTFKLVNALQEADKQFQLMIYPESRHGIGGIHYQRLMVDFIRSVLQLPEPGAGGEK